MARESLIRCYFRNFCLFEELLNPNIQLRSRTLVTQVVNGSKIVKIEKITSPKNVDSLSIVPAHLRVTYYSRIAVYSPNRTQQLATINHVTTVLEWQILVCYVYAIRIHARLHTFLML